MTTIDEMQLYLQNKTSKKITYQDIGDALGTGRANISKRAKSKSELKSEEEKKILNFFQMQVDKVNNVYQEYIELDYYENVFGSCGSGVMVFDESKSKLSITKDTIKDYTSSNKYSVINAVGASMAPAINDDDKVIIKHWNGEQIKDHRVYLFRYNDELFIKRLVKNIDQIVCISENKEFENRVISNLKAFNLIGEVVGLIREKV